MSPNPFSPQQIIRDAFIDGKTLTVKTAWQMSGSTELRKVVSRLRREGMDIKSYKRANETFTAIILQDHGRRVDRRIDHAGRTLNKLK